MVKEDYQTWLSKNITMCSCGKGNLTKWVEIYGTCNKCGKELSKQTTFINEMNSRLGLWRHDKQLRKRFFMVAKKGKI